MVTTLFDLSTVLAQLETDLGATSEALVGALAINPRTLQRWREGDALPQAASRVRLQALIALRDRLNDTFASPEVVRAWMQHPHRMLGGLTPLDAVKVGRIDAVDRALEALDSGIFV